MIERKLAEKFRRLYTENALKLSSYEEQLFSFQDPFDWVQLLSERAYVMREIYAENEELMAELWENCSEEITPEEAELLYDLAMGFYFDGHYDFAVLTSFCEKILPVFEELDMPEFLVAIYHVLGDEYAKFYRTLSDRKGMDMALNYYRKVIEQSKNYAKISSPEVREFIFEDYFNLISYLGNFYYNSNDKIDEGISLYEQARQLYESSEVQENDKDNTRINFFISAMDDAFLAKTMHIEEMTKEQRDKYSLLVKGMAERAYLDGGDVEGSPNYRICVTYRRLMHEITSDEVIDSFVKSINELIPMPDYSGDENTAYNVIMRHFKYACTIIMLLRRMKLDKQTLESYTERFLPKSMSVMNEIPYQFFTGKMLPVCIEWYHAAEPVVTGEIQKVHFIMQMIVRRQPFTYIHSQMVSQIAVMIAESMIEKCPEEFIGVRAIESVDDVKKNYAYLISFIKISGLVHDIGKCYIPEIVNRQNRSLNNTEYATIRKHSEIGYKEAQNNTALKPYSDIIIGHHKHYDGIHGYPLNYDNNESPVKIVIDLISIADSIEAGTDTLSRSYTHGKEFSKLLEELQSEAGSRYNPRIVEIIQSDEALKEKLTNITGQGRYDICYASMMEILGNAKEN